MFISAHDVYIKRIIFLSETLERNHLDFAREKEIRRKVLKTASVLITDHSTPPETRAKVMSLMKSIGIEIINSHRDATYADDAMHASSGIKELPANWLDLLWLELGRLDILASRAEASAETHYKIRALQGVMSQYREYFIRKNDFMNLSELSIVNFMAQRIQRHLRITAASFRRSQDKVRPHHTYVNVVLGGAPGLGRRS